MKVLYVSKALVVSEYREKLRALRRSVDVEAIVPAEWKGSEVETGPGDVPVTLRPVRFSGRNHLHYYPGLRQVFRSAQPDFVHIDEEPYSLVTTQISGICRRRRTPCLFFAWQNLYKTLPPPFGAFRRRVYRRVHGGIAGTEDAAEVLRRGGFTRPLRVIPQFGIDPERFRPDATWRAQMRDRLGVEPGQFTVLFAGHLEEQKGVHVLLDALAQVPDARLIVIGEGSQRERLGERARTLGVAGRVRFVGRVPSGEIARWFNAAEVTVLPSISTPTLVEQFGRVLVESMACAVPVIGSDSGGIPAVVGDAGIIVREGDARALAGAIAHLQRSPDQRRSLGERGRHRAATTFTHEIIARDTVAFYRELIAGVS